MKKIFFKILMVGITLCWMGVIFYFSHQTGEQSSVMSGKITNYLIRIFVPNFNSMTITEQNQVITNTSFIIRKIAHYSEYAVLGLFLYFSVSRFTKNQIIQISMVGIVGILYAISDEFHQSFIGGRSPMVRDVIIDSCGLLTMLLVLVIIANNRIGKKKKVEQYD